MKTKNPNLNLSEEELSKKLFMNLLGIFGLIVFSLLCLFVFAPKIGFLFGLVSKHRNEEAYKPQAVIEPPIFVEVPEAVKEKKTNLKGYAQSGSTVKLFVNGPEQAQTVAGADGMFNFTDVSLNEGKNMIFAKAYDQSSNESEKSEVVYIQYDKDAPKLEDIEPKENSTIKNLDKRITVSGKLNEKATITINDKLAIQNADFSFSYVLGVSEGNVTIKIQATDVAGNKAEKEFTVKYVKDSQ